MSKYAELPRRSPEDIAQALAAGDRLDRSDLIALSSYDTATLTGAARLVRDRRFGNQITYSRKVFIPLTQLCRDVCHYCTFAKTPKRVEAPYLDLNAVLEIARQGAAAGCNEALFTLGEKPELRYEAARSWLDENGFRSTIDYVVHAARAVLEQTGLLPHVNAGNLEDAEIEQVRRVAPSVGLMLETASDRLSGPGMPHYGSPDKIPATRLATLRRLGANSIPTTTGILVGIGETPEERIDSLLAIRELQAAHGHIQEVIVQNFRAKAGTLMRRAPEPTGEELIRTIALARLTLGGECSLQAPPNLSPKILRGLIDAGINDWGGVSPVTSDHVNPEAPWPALDALDAATRIAGKQLTQRLTVYPRYIQDHARWIDATLVGRVLERSDVRGLARESMWRSGARTSPPLADVQWVAGGPRSSSHVSEPVRSAVAKGMEGALLSEAEVVSLFEARDDDFAFVCQAADLLRRELVGPTVTYAVVRNINYTNVCTYGCKFCAFSKGRTHEDLRGKPYDLELSEVRRRVREAWDRGATEVCMQGGIHPAYTGETYLDLCRAVKEECPGMHVHAFSALEVTQGARTLNLPVRSYLKKLREAGLGSMPGTAAEVLDDEVRAILCPDKLSTQEWLDVIEAAHEVGIKTTATIMFGHVDRAEHWARHLLRLRHLQIRTGGFTEFVPLPFVAQEAPLYRKGLSRPGPTFRESVLMHAVSRIVLFPHIRNIQASWVKLGPEGVIACLDAGVNDLGGTLMNESITRAAGSQHGQESAPDTIEAWIRRAGRQPRQRTTLYGAPPVEQVKASFDAKPLTSIENTPLRRSYRTSIPIHQQHVITT
ncbi:bifunctional FO biosynthesis protein CofGH [Variovorax sp. V118]|uniref:5-amino-6-(D-ribitylamino)uracil--L-tyrosine 4-hydroxyphenyl transferase CofH n=1 Tax=Variovorax sp. V118 TaxID=3065954 RepID=UPI0034E8C1B5